MTKTIRIIGAAVMVLLGAMVLVLWSVAGKAVSSIESGEAANNITQKLLDDPNFSTIAAEAVVANLEKQTEGRFINRIIVAFGPELEQIVKNVLESDRVNEAVTNSVDKVSTQLTQELTEPNRPSGPFTLTIDVSDRVNQRIDEIPVVGTFIPDVTIQPIQKELIDAQTFDQIVGRQIDQLHFVGPFKDGVGHCFANNDAGDFGNHIVQTLQVLDIDRCKDVDTRREESLDVLPSLGVKKHLVVAGRVGVGQLIHHQQLWPAGQGRCQVKIEQLASAIGGGPLRQHVQAEHEGLRFRPGVGLDVADDHIPPFLGHLARRFEHGIGLAYARGRPEEDFQLAATTLGFFRLDAGQKFVGIRAVIGHGTSDGPARPGTTR